MGYVFTSWKICARIASTPVPSEDHPPVVMLLSMERGHKTGRNDREDFVSRLWQVLVVAVCTAAMWTACAVAQQTATISGTVVDPHTLAVRAARVSLDSAQSSVTATTSTDASGHFSFPGLLPGHYQIRVSASGFRDFTREVDTSQDANKDMRLTLQVATASTTVTVQSGRDGYTVPTTDTGSLTPMRVLDLPQTVQVVNRELIEEQQAFQFADTLSYLAGVTRASTNIAGGVGNEVSMRGFTLNTVNSYLRDGYKFFGVTKTDTADIEEVQLLKGPASALYGASEAGGTVNLITKKPTSTPYTALTMTGGSYKFLRPEFDISGPLGNSSKLYYRLNGVFEDTDSFRTWVHSRKKFIAPYLLWKIDPATSLAVLGELINQDRVSDYGVPIYGTRPAPVPVSTNYAEPWNNEEDRDRQFGYRFNHGFHSGWNLYNGFELTRFNANYVDVGPSAADPTNPLLVTRYSSNGLSFPYLYRYSQTNFTGTAKTGGIVHHLAVGFEAGWSTGSSLGPIGYAPSVNVLNPQTGNDWSYEQAVAAAANPFFTLASKTLWRNQAGFVQDQVDLGKHWKALGGLRFERYYQDSINLASNTHQPRTDYPASPRVGLVYEPKHWLSIYGSYIKSFIPVSPSQISSSGTAFAPERDHQWEGGVKAASESQRLSSTFAVFQVVKNNIVATDPNNSFFYVQNGQARSKGAEFEFRGNPVAGLNLLTSYAYIQAQLTKSTVFPVGNALPNAPRHSGAVWASYQAPRGLLRDLGLSVGIIAMSYRTDNYYSIPNVGALPGANQGALLPGYARLDVGSYYTFHATERQQFRLSFNMQNALDRVYYLASNGQNNVRPGSPRAFLIALKWTRQ